MRSLKFLITVGVLGLGFKLLPANSQAANRLEREFVAVPVPDEAAATPRQVLVYTSRQTSSAATRTQKLVEQLTVLKIPYHFTSSISQTLDSQDQQGLDRFKQLMHEQQPIVFVDGKAKANPPVEDVVTEYKKSIGES